MANPVSGTLSADGNGSEFNIVDKGLLIVGGTFDSGTATLQVKGANGTWYSSSQTYTASDVDTVDFGAPAICRINLAGSTSPSLYYEFRRG